MTENELNIEYFDWMYQLVCDRRHSSYRQLLYFLNNVDFRYTIDMDGNRETDGIDLRYRFGNENGFNSAMIGSFLDNHPCSVLEMMIALAIRCEEHIMDDPDIGNRTGQWFWSMIDNLGLNQMRGDMFDEDFVTEVVERFLNREYEPNGKGGLFTVHRCRYDLRDVEIWYQMCWYLDEIV